MARIRSVHPGLFTDEAFMAVSEPAQIFFIGLWTEADDQGVFEWKPITLRARLRPAKDGPVEPILSELEAANCVRSYELCGRKYGAVRNFCKYQRPKKPNAIHPITDEIRTYVALSFRSSEPDDDETGSSSELSPQMKEEGGRMEGYSSLRSESKGAHGHAVQPDLIGQPSAKPELPPWVPVESWSAFIEMRKKIRHPLTKRGAELIIVKLGQLRASGHDPGAVLDQSVMNSWRGVFELKGGTNGQGNRNQANGTGFVAAARGIDSAVERLGRTERGGLP